MNILTIANFILIVFILFIDDKKIDILKDEIDRLRDITELKTDLLSKQVDDLRKNA